MTVIARDRRGTAAVAGIVLILLGAGVLALREWGIDPIERIADAGWPLFVVLPGLALLAMALVPAPPRGVGFAIAGCIVTSIGLVLWWQEQTDRYETWAYAWALIGPGAAGLGMLVYGALTRTSDLVRLGLRLLAIAGVLFLGGAWFFETAVRHRSGALRPRRRPVVAGGPHRDRRSGCDRCAVPGRRTPARKGRFVMTAVPPIVDPVQRRLVRSRHDRVLAGVCGGSPSTTAVTRR